MKRFIKLICLAVMVLVVMAVCAMYATLQWGGPLAGAALLGDTTMVLVFANVVLTWALYLYVHVTTPVFDEEAEFSSRYRKEHAAMLQRFNAMPVRSWGEPRVVMPVPSAGDVKPTV